LSFAQADEWHFSGVERIVAVSDIHGAYDALVETLQEADVIDNDVAWNGGKTHLVITGDLLDRGPDSRLVMDLVIRLEQEARRAGGRVHQLLGNHEVMNLIGDLRYVADEEYAAFLDIESDQEREFWYQRYRRSQPVDSDEVAVRWEFDKRAPPGFFGHRRAFRGDGVYGKWLLEKPFMIVINDTAFVHGGMPPFVTEHGLTGVNVGLKNDLLEFVTTSATLMDKSVLSPIDGFKQSPAMLTRMMEAGQIEEEFVAPAEYFIALSRSPLHGPVGPTWYRGTASCNKLIEGDVLQAALDEIDATRVVFGHTTTITRRVQQRMDGRIVEIDTGMLKANYNGSGNALIIEDGELAVVNQDGRTNLSPIAHPVRVGHESMAVDDDELAHILSNSKITGYSPVGAPWKMVQIESGDGIVFAYFNEITPEDENVPELAAYRLDRLLGLGMVPVTVRREVDGRWGTLQFVPAATMTERERVATGAGWGAGCSVQRQMAAMYVFDSLVLNNERTLSSMSYSPDDWLLMLVDHDKSFSTGTGRPAYLDGVELAIGDQWREAMLALDDEVLRTELGDVLDEERLAALGKRRDALVSGSIH
jgi:hypothetical protein